MPGKALKVRKTDGKWDPKNRPLFFLAGSGHGGANYSEVEADSWAVRFQPNVASLYAVNDFADPGRSLSRRQMEREFLPSIDAGSPVFLDSGIFWLTNEHKRKHHISMDQALSLAPEEIDNFDWLFDTYVELCTEYRDVLWGYNELDQGGAVNKRHTRDRLNGLGLNPIPVYHPLNDGWAYFDELAQSHDRICWGNVVQASRYVRIRMLATLEERHRRYPDLWVHLLGYTPNDWLNAIPFDSCDSSTWTAVYRYPQAWKERAMAHTVGGFDHRYYYTPPISNGQSAKAGAASIETFDAVNRGFRHWRNRLHEEIGWVDFPKLRPGETELTK